MLSNQDFIGKSVDLKNLSLEEKIALVEDLWDDISNIQQNMVVTKEQKRELDLRLSGYRLNPDISGKWNIVREKLKSNL